MSCGGAQAAFKSANLKCWAGALTETESPVTLMGGLHVELNNKTFSIGEQENGPCRI